MAQALQSQVDMLVGDIYGERDYTAIGLSATTIASSFGKVVAQDRDLEDFDPADIAMALCRMVRSSPTRHAASTCCHACARQALLDTYWTQHDLFICCPAVAGVLWSPLETPILYNDRCS